MVSEIPDDSQLRFDLDPNAPQDTVLTGDGEGTPTATSQQTGPASVLQRGSRVGWALAGAGVFVYLAVSLLTRHILSADSAALWIGTMIGIAFRDSILGVILLVVLRWALARGHYRKPLQAGPSLVIGAIILIETLIQSGIVVYQATYAVDAVRDLTQVLSTGPSTAASNTNFGDWLNSYVHREQQILLDLQAAVAKRNVGGMLSADAFTSSETMESHKRDAIALQSDFKSAEARYNALLDGAPREVNALAMPSDFKQQFSQGFQSTAPKARGYVSQYFATEQSFLQKTELLYEFMENAYARSAYEIQGSQVVFANQVDLNEFNRRISEINQLAVQEQQVLQALQQGFEEQAQKLRTLQQ